MNRSFAFLVATFLISSWVFAGPAVLEKISVAHDDHSYYIYFDSNGKLEYKSSLVKSPPQIILDFPEAKHKLKASTLVPKENKYLSNIRIKEKTGEDKKILQVILDLKSDFAFSFKPTSKGFAVKLDQAQDSASEVVSNEGKKATSGDTINEVKKSSSEDVKKAGKKTQSGDGIKAANKAPSSDLTKTGLPAAQGTVKQIIPSPPPAPNIEIGAEDLVKVSVFELSQFDVEARVSGDGTITMPLVGSIEIRGLTKKEAENKIAAALEAKYVNNPNVSINIVEYKSKQVSVLGAVSNPGPYYILSRRTLIQLISEAGGLAEDAGKKCFIFRQNSPKIELDLDELMKTGDPTLNIPIVPGDVIHVPPVKTIVVYVLGAVKTPGAVELTTDMPVTLVAAIAKAGGMGEGANKSKVEITRKDDNGKQVVLKANFKDIVKGKTADVPLSPGDVINVSESFF
jgi:polysaccharide biosynthesis/export protein